jgi:adenosine deaminase
VPKNTEGLTSNLKTKTVPSLAEHHLVTLHQQGQPYCICTDDSGVFATTLSQEYVAAAEALAVSKGELWSIA